MDVMGKRVAGALAGTVVLSGLVAAAAAPAAYTRQHSAKSLDTYGATFKLDRSGNPVVRTRPGTHTVLGGGGRAVASRSLSRGAAPRAGTAAQTGSCLPNRHRRGFVDKGVIHREYANNKAYYVRFLYFYYRQNNARRAGPRRRLQRQFEICTVGGAHSKGGNRLDRVMSYMVFTSKKDRLIKWDWGVGKDVGKASRSLTFSVPVKPVTIGASIPIGGSGRLTGAQGYDKDTPKDLRGYEFNQVVGLWEGPTGGSTDFEGNVAHGLWEIPQRTPASKVPAWGLEAGVEYECGRIFGGCESP
jgi:hypothetical protein